MRGGVSYDYMLYGMSYIEREIMSDFVTKRVNEEVKTTHPVY